MAANMLNGKELAIGELVVGQPLERDLLDPSGRVLLKKGHVLSQKTYDRWTEFGFTRVLVDVSADPPPPPAAETSSKLLRGYSTDVLNQCRECVQVATRALDEVVSQLNDPSQAEIEALQAALRTINDTIGQDADAVLYNASCEHSTLAPTRNEALAKRSVLLSTIGSAAATYMGLSESECSALATAGLLHDVALFDEMLSVHLADPASQSERDAVMQKHPQLSAEVLSKVRGITDQVRLIVSQVHEQIDGLGFPRGLSNKHLGIPSRILNLVDAYLTLTDPNSTTAFVPADALAYLAGQTGSGAFDLDCMRALLGSLSIYSMVHVFDWTMDAKQPCCAVQRTIRCVQSFVSTLLVTRTSPSTRLLICVCRLLRLNLLWLIRAYRIAAG